MDMDDLANSKLFIK